MRRLRPLLEQVVQTADREAQLAVDPISAVHRYTDPHDQEVAGVIASVLAFGRVAAFGPVVHTILDTADRHGGPRAYVEKAHQPSVIEPLAALRYRWITGADLQVLVRALGRILRRRARLGDLFVDRGSSAERLGAGLDGLREAARLEQGATSWSQVSRGVRYLFPHPASGSACKRWCMFLRWMVRPPEGDTVAGIDLGIWEGDPARLVMPLDTHVLRIGRLIGLTVRRDTSWRTALDLTASLACIEPADPLRYDFAVAHLGISGGCTGSFVAPVCASCGLRSVCRVNRPVERSIG